MGNKRTTVYFVTDVHGSDKCFRKFVNAAKFFEADVIILGGDITGKMIVPIVEQGDGSYLATLHGSKLVIKSIDELEANQKKIRDSGFYPILSTKNEVEELMANDSKVKALFKKLMAESVDGWIQLADERLKGTGVRCYISPGNDDFREIDSHLIDTGVVFNPEEKVVRIDDVHEMITLGTVNHTPWHSPREVDEDVLEGMIEKMASKVENMQTCIFNIHVPPIDTIIDQAPALDATFKPIVQGGRMQMTSAGSVATRRTIEKYQPMLGLHGHIHESKGQTNIRKTPCFNPGSEYTDGTLRGILLNLEGNKIKNYTFTSG